MNSKGDFNQHYTTFSTNNKRYKQRTEKEKWLELNPNLQIPLPTAVDKFNQKWVGNNIHIYIAKNYLGRNKL